MAMYRFLIILVAGLCAMTSLPTHAQDREVPYWASIRADVLNMRVGPSQDYRIEWVYKRKGLPLRVIRRVDAWRFVEDPNGAQGWVSASLLSPERSAIIIGDGLAAIRSEPDPASKLKWNAEPGVVGYLGECENGFCQFNADGHKGWVRAKRLWGAGEP